MARRLHPDAAASPPGRATAEQARRFIAVREAYDTLSDPHRRALYDRSLASSPSASHQELDERSHWRKHWQDQIAELCWRSIDKDSEDNLSWGARMRRKWGESLN
ncbi:Chaperone protein dnaJ 20, chloroplastic [Ananas comosus]|nr:Chaperone protein dnaJ 20, chloroplastic [Ananas comosus]